MASDDGGSNIGMLKGALLVLGGLAAVGIALTLFKPVMFVAALAAAGFLGYKLVGLTSGKSLSDGGKKKALKSGPPDRDDFAARMAELERLEKDLDRQIKR